MSDLDILNMSDEDFSKLGAPPEPKVEEEITPPATPVTDPDPVEVKSDVEDDAPEDDPVEEEEDVEEEGDEEAEPPKSEKNQDNTQADDDDGGAPPAEEKPEDPAPKQEQKKPEEGAADLAGTTDPGKPKAPTPAGEGSDHKAFFEKVMAPFKANGKVIQLQSADEVIALMQMGANYTKKMQAIQQNKKYLMMLENNGLLDEEKLSLHIDLDKGNPEAIKKFLKDKKLEPMELDLSEEPNYQQGAHAVTDQEAGLATAIDDLKTMDGGAETIQSVQAWDAASKKVLWDNPEILNVIHGQRQSGVYDRISTEIERRKTLGQIGPTVPFLQAYKIIGDELAAQGALQVGTKPATPAQPPVGRTPVAVRPAKIPTKVADNSRVRAAAPSRPSPNQVKRTMNPTDLLSMSDEDFLKLKHKV